MRVQQPEPCVRVFAAVPAQPYMQVSAVGGGVLGKQAEASGGGVSETRGGVEWW